MFPISILRSGGGPVGKGINQGIREPQTRPQEEEEPEPGQAAVG